MLFVYGTLQFPEVLLAVLGRVPTMSAVTLPGWRAAALPGAVYPGLVRAAPPRAATGRLLEGLGPGEWDVLDEFEGDAYERRRVPLDDGRTPWTYVWRAAHDVAPHDWDPAAFVVAELPAYVVGCATWREALS